MFGKNRKRATQDLVMQELKTAGVQAPAKQREYRKGTIKLSDAKLVERLRFHGLSEEDLGVIATWEPTCRKVSDKLVDIFYDRILKQPETKAILLKYSSVEKQRPRLTKYALTLFSGVIDDQYVAFRVHVGKMHDDIDLDSNWYVAMYEIIRQVLVQAVRDDGATDAEAQRFADALNRLIQVDIALVTTALGDSRMGKIHALRKKQAETMQSLINELIGAAREGKLSTRVNPDKYEGEVRTFVMAVNEMLDAIVKPVQEASTVLRRIADRDLTARVEGAYRGDHALIKDALNKATAKLQSALIEVGRAVDEVNTGSTQVALASQSLSDGSTQQASSLEEISSTMDQITSQTRQTADNSSQAQSLSVDARSGAEEGNRRMKEMLEAMHEINEASSQISKIIKVIDEIAFQTNLLALNAAVEAARAGVHGKGFAVVAEEVRNLAGRSARAAKETTELIEGSLKKVEKGYELANETATSLGDIVESVTKMTDIISEIASASREQASGIDQMNAALVQIGEVTQGNAANSEESAAASEELSGQAMHLQQMVNNFELGIGRKHLSQQKQQQRSGGSQQRRLATRTQAPASHRPKTPAIKLDDDDFGGF